MGKAAMNPGSSTNMPTETVDVTEEETAEIHLYKHIHLLPTNEANSSDVFNFNLSNRTLHQNNFESSNPITPRSKKPGYVTQTDYSNWYCGHCQKGPMIVGSNYHCIYCGHPKDVYSYYGTVYVSDIRRHSAKHSHPK